MMSPLLAQTPATGTPAAPTRHMNASWQDGLVLESDDGDYRIQFGTFMRFDGRFSNRTSGSGIPNTFLMRTLRATVQGRIARYFTFKLQPDFTGLTGVPVADAWADIQFSDAVHVRFGRDKVPIGTEVLLQDTNTVFLERGLTANLMPSRDTGIQVYGDIHGSTISYTKISRNGDSVYQYFNHQKAGDWIGVAIREGDILSIGWDKSDGRNLGVSVYKIEKGDKGPTLDGEWTSYPGGGTRKDTLKWSRKVD